MKGCKFSRTRSAEWNISHQRTYSSPRMHFRPIEVYQRLNEVGINGVGISVISAFELEVGALRAPSRTHGDQVRSYLAELTILPLDDSARQAYGTLRVDLERRGEKIGPYDMLIAAHALSLGATLVTNNEREFKRVKGLRVENWVH